jgi:hypothetical protein
LPLSAARWGPAHVEIRMTSRGPRLIETNMGRWNGLDFKMVVDLCYGYNAFDATIDTYISPAAVGFDRLPARPPATLACYGRLVTLVSSVEGRLVRLRHAEELERMDSLITFEPVASEPGDWIRHTVDLDTCAGLAHLVHRDAQVVAAEYQRLRALQSTLFEVAVDDGAGEERAGRPPGG